jgi:hypothetical protein
MSDVLKGNFKTRGRPIAPVSRPEGLEERFEKEALKRLGGSIAFVSKKKIVWDLKKPGSKD